MEAQMRRRRIIHRGANTDAVCGDLRNRADRAEDQAELHSEVPRPTDAVAQSTNRTSRGIVPESGLAKSAGSCRVFPGERDSMRQPAGDSEDRAEWKPVPDGEH